MFFRLIRKYLTQKELSKYDILELSPSASIKEVKKQFKVLSKKYHPDLNNHLEEEEKKLNSEKFVLIVSAYDTLKDAKKKQQYDIEMRSSGGSGTIIHSNTRRNQEWHNKYYGEAKYYSRANSGSNSSSSSYSSSGLNNKRNRVYFNDDNYSGTNNSTFSGRHINYGDRFDVPHFNYQEHLTKHLKFEQRLLNKNLSESDRKKIIEQLGKEGEIDEELLTKHLMRQAKRKEEELKNPYSTTSNTNNNKGTYSNPNSAYMYQAPQDSGDGMAFKAFAFLGAGSSLYYLWTLL